MNQKLPSALVTVCSAALLLALASPSLAQTSNESVPTKRKSPVPAASKPEKSEMGMPVINFVEYDLANGLHVILHQNRSVPVVSTNLIYHVGSKNERSDRTGFAHFFEHLMFEGSANIQRGEIDKLISAAGGNLNASTHFDITDYYFNLPSNQLKLALWIESERMLHGKIDETGVETQRKVVKEERRLAVDNAPFGTVFENLAAQVFEGTPYEWTPIGSLQYIDQASIDEFRDFYRRFYAPNNATLAVAGNFDIEEAKSLIQSYFGSIPRGKEIERPEFSLKPQETPKLKTVELSTTPLPSTLHSWRGPVETSPDAPALELLANILATGRSSRLYTELVRREQIASDVSVFTELMEKGGVVGIFVIGNPDSLIQKLDRLITEEIHKVRESGITAEELQKAKNQKLTALASAFSTMANRAENLARFHVIYGDTEAINRQAERYQNVTLEDVQRVARQYLTPEGVNVLNYPVSKSPKSASSK
jgi:zinc protease